MEAVSRGAAESAAGLCLCDADDLIRYANAAFIAAFFPGFDGRPADFMETITTAMGDGTGIRLVSTTPDDFARQSRRARRALSGSRSFSTDMIDGSWWGVTDTKLSNGWVLAIAQDISPLKREEAKLRDAHDSALAESQTDDLTGAPNRRHGLRRAEALWEAAQKAGHPLSIALMDVDHFKAINDAHGHETGDRALSHLVRVLMAAIRPEDAFSRLGGDEFLLVRPGAAGGCLDAALGIILATLPPVALEPPARPLHLSISVGVAEMRANEAWPALLHRADMALYRAKKGGRSRIARAG